MLDLSFLVVCNALYWNELIFSKFVILAFLYSLNVCQHRGAKAASSGVLARPGQWRN